MVPIVDRKKVEEWVQKGCDIHSSTLPHRYCNFSGYNLKSLNFRYFYLDYKVEEVER